MRLIDASELLKHKSDHETISTHLIWNAPTVDAVPVIRCKECIYYRGDHEYCVNDMFAIENGFCNWAERKEE